MTERRDLRQCLTRMSLLLLTMMLAAKPTLELQGAIGESKPKREWVYAKQGQQVTLHALLRGGEVKDVRWFKVEPAIGAIDNTTPTFHFEPVTYAETAVPDCEGKLTCPADITPTKLAKVPQLPGVGTMAFRVEVTTKDGVTLSTPGMASTKYGGLTPEVYRVTLRRDDTLIGYASELLNTPYIFGSAGPDGRNQSDLLIGSDCADLIIYARRRSGKKAVYTSSYEIDRQAPLLKTGAVPKPGDLVHFPASRHVAILFEDREPVGQVDENDLILHTCWAPPTVQRMGDIDCVSRPYRVLRFPD
jgi:cell wall-associated NlpC family hydrolase